MAALFRSFLSNLIRTGHLEVETADGIVAIYGDRTGPKLGIKLIDRAAERELLLDPTLTMGELYMDGRLLVTKGDLYDVLALGAQNIAAFGGPRWVKIIEDARIALRHIKQRNDRARARKNIAHHYDLNAKLYDLFLDPDRQYSCAYFETPDASLDDAQLAKKRHIAAKMLVREGHDVLDIGCGFGGMALYLAEMAGANVTGVTLSQEQHGVATQRTADLGLAERVSFHLKDYRDVDQKFDRIVSVGMFEHVGAAGFDEYFQNVSRLLKDDGVMLLHAIGRSSRPGATNPWVAKYIFPGGYIPALSEVFAAIERSGLYVTDTEILRLHYADTLKDWRERFMARRDEAKALYDERFCRMWEFYLAGSETAFRVDGHMVFQIQLAKRQTVVPRTRDYIGRREAELREKEDKNIGFRMVGE
ncbi:SAM-dependent methyltransferase [Methylovirgula sp. 4M-Z18]|uniref:SAM-dependent methyltransferase n=1 Tax=Methylovirgula sp. 4M-Z18 TaxID=2293567 RepID=UPI000E2FD0B1|nr:cyclopropane-fatty-acyl-phospholipid synthase family protein [Methylovirgula sp. 4M-Z18]RFB78703.1 methyltransferase domain-containing protein [Methylovirgula sp. 4M-Z18]